jgi:hypothetical protein
VSDVTRQQPEASPAQLEAGLRYLRLLEHAERALGGGPEITVLCWPDESGRLDDLRRLGLPRLVVVGATGNPPAGRGELEDWVRLPVEDRDVQARLLVLRERALQRPPRPVLDGSGRLIFSGRWVALSRTEERLACPLVERFGQVVHYDELLAAGWPDGGTDLGTFRPRLSRLRRHCLGLGLEVVNVRGAGHVLQPAEANVHTT